MRRSTKTTIGGVLAAVGILLGLLGKLLSGEEMTPEDGLAATDAVGGLLTLLGLVTIGTFARDDDVSSEGTKAPKNEGG